MNQKKPFIKRLAGYFLRGVAVLTPIGLTAYLIYSAINWVDNAVRLAVPQISFPGFGFIIVVIAITITGILFSGIIGRTVGRAIDGVMTRTPFVKYIYSSVKDMIDAFVGEKRKFNNPVLVQIDPIGNQILGFVTRNDLNDLGIRDKVAVYCPNSYAISGNVLIVSSQNVTPVDANATEVMKFIVSGGVTGLD